MINRKVYYYELPPKKLLAELHDYIVDLELEAYETGDFTSEDRIQNRIDLLNEVYERLAKRK